MATRDQHAPFQETKRRSPSRTLPRIRCDFNSVGWGGEDDDGCYYSFDEKPLAQRRVKPGMRVFIYEPSRDELVMGCEAELEQYRHAFSNQLRWRLRPIPNTGYLGQLR